MGRVLVASLSLNLYSSRGNWNKVNCSFSHKDRKGNWNKVNCSFSHKDRKGNRVYENEVMASLLIFA